MIIRIGRRSGDRKWWLKCESEDDHLYFQHKLCKEIDWIRSWKEKKDFKYIKIKHNTMNQCLIMAYMEDGSYWVIGYLSLWDSRTGLPYTEESMKDHGYDNVTKLHYDAKGNKTETRMFSVWMEGVSMTGCGALASHLGNYEARSFVEACDKAIHDSRYKDLYDRDKLTVSGCRLHDNEGAARRRFG